MLTGSANPAVSTEMMFSLGGPRTRLEATLLHYWQERLKRTDFGVTTPLLTGDAETDAELAAAIGSLLDADLSDLRFPDTIAEQAVAILPQARHHRWLSLTPIRTQPMGRPVYFIHCGAGQIKPYFYLAPYIPATRPLYAMKQVGVNGECPLPRYIEDYATLYVDELLTLQPEGPYTLAGFSYGGVICFGMALELEKRGHKCDLLIFLDAIKEVEKGRMAKYHINQMLERSFAGKLRYVWEKGRGRLKRDQKHREIEEGLTRGERVPYANRHIFLLHRCMAATDAFEGSKYEGKVLLIEGRSARAYQWEKFCPDLHTHAFPCVHNNLFREPFVSSVGALIGQHL